MPNGEQGVVQEVQRILQAGGEIPQRVQNRMVFAAIVELNKEVQVIKVKVEEAVRYRSLLWFLVNRPRSTIGAIVLVFALLTLLFSAEAREIVLSWL
jgi:hypothetical protein